MTINTVNTGSNDFQAALGIDPASSTAAKAKSSPTLGQDEFLKLMIAQFKNQDPFKPLASGEFLSQLAQFSTVSGVQDLQTSFKAMSTSLVSNQALQASSLLGRSVLVKRSDGLLAAGGTISGAVDVPSSVTSVVVSVTDQNGQLVQQLGLGAHTKGLAEFTWDGKLATGAAAAPGIYTMTAQTLVSGSKQAAADVLTSARVESVTIGADQSGLTLSLEGLGDIAFSDVRQIK